MTVDYLATAKDTIAQASGNHPVEQVKAWALVALASAVIDIAETLKRGKK